MTAPYMIQSGWPVVCWQCCSPLCLPACDPWPNPSVTFTPSGVTPGGGCCGGAFGSPGYTYSGLSDCLNRAFTIPLFESLAGETADGTAFSCTDTYLQTCQVLASGEPGSNQVTVATGVDIARLKDTATQTTAAVVVSLVITLTLNGQGSGTDLDPDCHASARYEVTYDHGEGFDCGGPWVLTRGETTGDAVSAWPSTITVNPSGSASEAFITDCCSPTVEDCDADFRDCVDGACVSSPTGELDPVTCEALCGTGVICPTPPCGDGSDGGDSGNDITTACCGSAIGRTITVAITGAITAMWGLAWSVGFGFWAGSTTGCGTFITGILLCQTGEVAGLRFILICGGTVVIDTLVPAGIGDSYCAPLRLHFGDNVTCGLCSGPIGIALSDGGGGS